MCRFWIIYYTCGHENQIRLSKCLGNIPLDPTAEGTANPNPKPACEGLPKGLTISLPHPCGPCYRVPVEDDLLSKKELELDGVSHTDVRREKAEEKYHADLFALHKQFPLEPARSYKHRPPKGRGGTCLWSGGGPRRGSGLKQEVIAEEVIDEWLGWKESWAGDVWDGAHTGEQESTSADAGADEDWQPDQTRKSAEVWEISWGGENANGGKAWVGAKAWKDEDAVERAVAVGSSPIEQIALAHAQVFVDPEPKLGLEASTTQPSESKPETPAPAPVSQVEVFTDPEPNPELNATTSTSPTPKSRPETEPSPPPTPTSPASVSRPAQTLPSRKVLPPHARPRRRSSMPFSSTSSHFGTNTPKAADVDDLIERLRCCQGLQGYAVEVRI
jgi:hypothetical protein